MSKVYKVSRRLEAIFAATLAVILLTCVIIYLFVPFDDYRRSPILGFVAMPIGIAIIALSFYSVKEIHLSDNVLAFYPIGLKIEVSDLIEISNLDGFSTSYLSRHTGRFEIKTRARGFRWIPLNVLWVGDLLLVRAYGVPAKEFAMDLHQILEKQKKR